ncbi:uncharacterized protein LOC142333643 isoform X2 [Lycorma delicatula]|uniref:uncharacterized protein LOC142333643 isoform X2 n=1 Tax=Lycorma delicatula TaxID=130591 RepID=UPI003F50D78F
MNPIYSYKYLWLIEFLIFISLCNDILADNNRSRIKIPAPIETVKNYDIFKRTCEKFGFFPNKIGLYKRCIEMVWILEPNLNPSDMEEVAKNVKPWNISLVHARELLTNLIEYKWGVTEYGLFLQQLYKYPNRMNFVQNVMKAMPWEKWKLFCDVRFAKRFETYEMMPFILTSQERLEKLTEYMVWLHEKVNIMVKNRNSRRRRRRRNTVQAEAFGCPYSFVSAVIDLNKKKEGYDINQLYQGLCLDSLYEKWELDLFRKFCNEVGNSDIEVG